MNRSDKMNHAFEAYKQHEAQLFRHMCCSLEVLDWRQPGMRNYAVRYVFDGDGEAIYISGDLGDAVVYPTWPATLEDTVAAVASPYRGVKERYFLEKVKTASDRYEYDRDEAISYIKSHISDIDDDDLDTVMLDWNDCWGLERIGNGAAETLAAYDDDYWEWIGDAGRSIDQRVYLWLVGMCMAWEQLTNNRQERETK